MCEHFGEMVFVKSLQSYNKWKNFGQQRKHVNEQAAK